MTGTSSFRAALHLRTASGLCLAHTGTVKHAPGTPVLVHSRYSGRQFPAVVVRATRGPWTLVRVAS